MARTPLFRKWSFFFVLTIAACLAMPAPLEAEQARIPTKEEVSALLAREPPTLKSWPAWRVRLLSWLGDRTNSVDEAFSQARALMKAEADSHEGRLVGALEHDAFAWYLYGSAVLYGASSQEQIPEQAKAAEPLFRQSLLLDPGFGRAHRNLAIALLLAEHPATPEREAEAEESLTRAKVLAPDCQPECVKGQVALMSGRFGEAEHVLTDALAQYPDDSGIAIQIAQAIVSNRNRAGSQSQRLADLARRFPQDGTLTVFHGLALAMEDKFRLAVAEFEHARQLGVDPASVLDGKVVNEIERLAQPGWIERGLWWFAYFMGFYAVVMAGMALCGLLLSRFTRGTAALEMLAAQPTELVRAGQVVRSGGESWLARFYMAALTVGLLLFYVAVPVVAVGLLGSAAGLIYLIFLTGHIPVKLVIIIGILGLVMAWSVIHSVFVSARGANFGLPKTAQDLPRLHACVAEVAARVDTPPVDDLSIAPGSEIGVRQEGRGPFGIFGIKRRVLIMGMSSLNILTVDQLKAILAHEYAHFSHGDTFFSRFIYQVTLSLEHSLRAVGGAGGWITYINPFFWFLYLYYYSYSLLSAGFSRSREFLADRMAATLYGSDAFADGLVKVATTGSLFDATIYPNVEKMLAENKAFVNMYEAFREYHANQLTTEERQNMEGQYLKQPSSLFASHPTVAERLEAVASLPKARTKDATLARNLIEQPEELEKELTQFVTGYVQYVLHLQQQTAAQAAS